jgi:predicted secreted hydrolase
VGRIGIRVRRKGTRSIKFPAIIFAILFAAVPTTSACTGSAGPAPSASGTSPTASGTPPSASGTSPSASGTTPTASDTTPTASDTVHGCKTSVSLPKDEAPHSDSVEWWYFSGHLSGKDAKGRVHTYGYEYVTFQLLGLAPKPVYLGNLSVVDLTRKAFKFGGEEASYAVQKTPNKFALHTGNWTMSGASGRDTLKAAVPDYRLQLGLRTTEPAVLEGSKCGYISLASLGSSYYYSWTSLATTGTIVDHGVTLNVTGKSWMDHEWGPMNLTSGGGWDWFSMQLSNGQQYMLYFIRNKKGQVVETAGTRVADGGKDITYLTGASTREEVTGSWTSPATHIKYGSGWQITVPGGQLTVAPDLRDQEVDLVNTQGTAYWEGDVAVKGKIGSATVSGDGYTELLPSGF